MNAPLINQSAADELDALIVQKASMYLGDFDAWYREDDPDNVAHALELVQSVALARVLTRAQREQRLEKRWGEVWGDMVEEYAQAASWDRERGFRPYADRRGW